MGHTTCAPSRTTRNSSMARRDHYSRCQSLLYYKTESDGNLKANDKVIPVKDTGGVPMEMVPYHKLTLWLLSGMVPVSRLRDSGVLIPLERECSVPVFFLYAAIPVWIFL